MARQRLTKHGTRRSSMAGALNPQEVAGVAYELFEHRGGRHGQDLEDWLEAEAIVRQRYGTPPGEGQTDFL